MSMLTYIQHIKRSLYGVLERNVFSLDELKSFLYYKHSNFQQFTPVSNSLEAGGAVPMEMLPGTYQLASPSNFVQQ